MPFDHERLDVYRLECAATQDILFACGGISSEEHKHGREQLERIVCMLSRMTEK